MKNTIIFDMDGVLSDTEVIHAAVKRIILERYFSITLTEEEITTRYAGTTEFAMFKDVTKRFGVSVADDDIKNAVEQKWLVTYQLLQERPVRAIAGAVDFVKECLNRGLNIGVASGAPLSFIHYILANLGIGDCFRAIASSEEVSQGKPAPDVFLLCAERLGVQPMDCLVIEDSRNGMLAAAAAGMACLGLVEDLTGDYPTNYLIDSLIAFDRSPVFLSVLESQAVSTISRPNQPRNPFSIKTGTSLSSR